MASLWWLGIICDACSCLDPPSQLPMFQFCKGRPPCDPSSCGISEVLDSGHTESSLFPFSCALLFTLAFFISLCFGVDIYFLLITDPYFGSSSVKHIFLGLNFSYFLFLSFLLVSILEIPVS